MATGIYYFTNLNNASAAASTPTAPDVTYALYSDSSLSTPVLNWINIIKNGLNNNYGDPSGNTFGWTIAYSDLNTSGTLEADGSWISANDSNGLSGATDITSGRYASATILILCPAFYNASTTFNVGPPASGLIPMYTGVISYQTTGKTPITNTPDLITASGLTIGDASTFYSAPSLSTSTDRWKVSQRFFLNGTSTSLNTLVTSNSLVDSTNVSSTYTQSPTVYFLTKVSAVYALSFYANLTDANAGIANNDNYFDISGGSAGRIAYGVLGTNSVEPIGDISGYTSWNLLDEAGNPYLNPINTNSALPSGTTNWYLYPFSALPPPSVVSVLSYYSNSTDALAGAASDDYLTSTLGGATNRFAYTLADISAVIGYPINGGSVRGTQTWSLYDISGNSYGSNLNYGDTIPGSSVAWYLFPPSISPYFSYYANSTDAQSGVTNFDGSGNATVDGTSTHRIAYSAASSSTKIGLIQIGGDISGTTSWDVLDSSGNLLAGGPYTDGQGSSAFPTTSSTNFYLYPASSSPPSVVSILSYYSNSIDAAAGVANNDYLTSTLGGSTHRFAYLLYDISGIIGNPVDGGNIGTSSSWVLLDISGAYGPNSSNDDPIPGSSSAWYLYPLNASPYFSYYANSTYALSGVTNSDGSDNATVGGTSTHRIACSAGKNTTPIGQIEIGGNIGGTTQWNVLDSSGNLLAGGPYSNTQTSDDFAPTSSSTVFYLYPYSSGAAPCFLEGSQILCLVDEKETYLPIEKMRKGTLVKTLNSGYKMVHIIGKRDIPNFNDSNRIKDRLYKLTSAQYPALTSDLYLTGCHSTLVDSLTEEQKEGIKKMLSVVCVTEGKYRLPACLDNNAEPWQSKGTYTVWHFALDDQDPLINFGVYANGGLIVETGSIRYLQGKANMELV